MTRFFAWLLCISLVTACNWPSAASPTSPPSLTGTAPTPAEASTSTPGLVIRGHVRLSDGAPLTNVIICLNFASYPGQVVARTDQTGYYQSNFVPIPGDEMIGVWALLAGYSFEPQTVRWRHYHGFEEQVLDFAASATSATAPPPAACS